jgi:hypothetical protein
MTVCRLVHSRRHSKEEDCLEALNCGNSASETSVTNSGRRSITSQKIWILLYWSFHSGAAENSCIPKCAALWTFPDVSKDRISFTCRVKQSKNNGLPSIDDEGAMIIFETSGTTCPAKLRHIPAELNFREHRCENLKILNEVFLLKYRVCFLLRISLTHIDCSFCNLLVLSLSWEMTLLCFEGTLCSSVALYRNLRSYGKTVHSWNFILWTQIYSV